MVLEPDSHASSVSVQWSGAPGTAQQFSEPPQVNVTWAPHCTVRSARAAVLVWGALPLGAGWFASSAGASGPASGWPADGALDVAIGTVKVADADSAGAELEAPVLAQAAPQPLKVGAADAALPATEAEAEAGTEPVPDAMTASS